MRATKARSAVVSFWLLFTAGGLACADELIACLALSGARTDLIERHTHSLPAISLTDGQTRRGNAVDRPAALGSKLR